MMRGGGNGERLGRPGNQDKDMTMESGSGNASTMEAGRALSRYIVRQGLGRHGKEREG